MEQGYQLLQKTSVADRIAEMKADRVKRVEVNQDYVLDSITDTMERCKQAAPVLDRKGAPVMIETADGDIVPAYTFQAANVLKGAELLGKHLGTFLPDAATPDIHIHMHDKAKDF